MTLHHPKLASGAVPSTYRCRVRGDLCFVDARFLDLVRQSVVGVVGERTIEEFAHLCLEEHIVHALTGGRSNDILCEIAQESRRTSNITGVISPDPEAARMLCFAPCRICQVATASQTRVKTDTGFTWRVSLEALHGMSKHGAALERT